jgi:uncharacterized membrane protein
VVVVLVVVVVVVVVVMVVVVVGVVKQHVNKREAVKERGNKNNMSKIRSR